MAVHFLSHGRMIQQMVTVTTAMMLTKIAAQTGLQDHWLSLGLKPSAL